MVSLPRTLDETSADVAAACCLPENLISVGGRERLPVHLATKLQFSVAPPPSQ
jgi:hypothetical protein